MNFVLVPLKTLTGTNSLSCSESRIKLLFMLSFALIGVAIVHICSLFP
jgi:hypothetical protein